MALKSSSPRLLLIPVVIGGIFGLLYLWSGWQRLDYGLYDLYLHIKPPVKEDPRILLLNVDDEAIIRSGSWPWPRGLMAQGLEVMAEFGAAYAVFDIEYLERSPMSVDKQYLDVTLKTAFAEGFRDIQTSTRDVILSLAGGTIPRSSLDYYAEELASLTQSVGDDLYYRTRSVAVENDSYLGKAMALFGNSFITLHLRETREEITPPDLRSLAHSRFTQKNTLDPQGFAPKMGDYLIPIAEISRNAKGAGFTNVPIDSDGYRRRMDIVASVDGHLTTQLALTPFLDLAGSPEVHLKPGALEVRGTSPAVGGGNFSIPLDGDYRMLINWPKKDFDNSFRDLSFYRLTEYRETERDLEMSLSALRSNVAWSLYPGSNPLEEIKAAWGYIEDTWNWALGEPGEPSRKAYIAAREEYYRLLGTFRTSGVMDQLILLLQEAKAGDLPAKAAVYDELINNIKGGTNQVFLLMDRLTQYRKNLREALEGSICFIGWTSIASTDLGVTPFSEKYANVGTHASVFNTLLQRDFLTPWPLWFSALLAMVFPLGLIFLLRRLSTGLQMAAGLGGVVVLFLAGVLIFSTTGVYISLLSPLMAGFLSFLSYSLTTFLLSEQEKSFLRKAFSTYLSGDVINQIVSDPSLLKLGGQKMWISAMFTDVKGFSTISEKLDPEHLVRLLNIYLSGMSDIILENRGTIDKFEGDAIICFFGAPVHYETHAQAICRAALDMKKKEEELNRRFLGENLSPFPLLTRIGINTGDMVVGNMGTERKMDYTIMGNAVNLAARLEGVNKLYGTWILATQTTRSEAGDDFVWRQLDRVRVVGINEPLRLYELVGFAAELTEEKRQYLGDFQKALDLFEERRWEEAQKAFETLQAAHPSGPEGLYLKRCREFLAVPPPDTFDGIFNLTEK